jgi:uncharacterized protein with FMN-binding domain
MRRAITAVLGAAAVALPSADAWAAARSTESSPKKKVVTVTKTVAGSTAEVDRWGQLQVTLVVKKTTTTIGKKKTVKRRITSVTVPVYPNHTDRSVYINQQALPLLVQEVLQAQLNPSIQLISGATDTSYAFQQSLQSAILRARQS